MIYEKHATQTYEWWKYDAYFQTEVIISMPHHYMKLSTIQAYQVFLRMWQFNGGVSLLMSLHLE